MLVGAGGGFALEEPLDSGFPGNAGCRSCLEELRASAVRPHLIQRAATDPGPGAEFRDGHDRGLVAGGGRFQRLVVADKCRRLAGFTLAEDGREAPHAHGFAHEVDDALGDRLDEWIPFDDCPGHDLDRPSMVSEGDLVLADAGYNWATGTELVASADATIFPD